MDATPALRADATPRTESIDATVALPEAQRSAETGTEGKQSDETPGR
jgi:hypothetical protein